MTNVKHAASILALSAAAVFSGAASAGNGDIYYPENPNPGHSHSGPKQGQGQGQGQGQAQGQGQNQGQSSVNGNKNTNQNAADANAAATAAAQAAVNARQQLTADQRQMLDAQLSQANKQTVNTGATNVQTGATTVSSTSNYEAAKTFGNVAPIIIQPTGQCGSGFGINLSTGSFGAGIGGSSQNMTCLSGEAARVMMEEGRAIGDKGMIAVGAATYRRLYPAVNEATHSVILSLRQSCWERAAKTSVILLTGDDKNGDALECDGEYVKGTREAAERAEAALKAKAEADARAVDLALQLALEANRAKEYAAKLTVDVNVTNTTNAAPATATVKSHKGSHGTGHAATIDPCKKVPN